MDKNNQLESENLEFLALPPQHKLDADEFYALDSDGSTEGVISSGSLGYASLQASQTDAVFNYTAQIAYSVSEPMLTEMPIAKSTYSTYYESAAVTASSVSPTKLDFGVQNSPQNITDKIGSDSINSPNISQQTLNNANANTNALAEITSASTSFGNSSFLNPQASNSFVTNEDNSMGDTIKNINIEQNNTLNIEQIFQQIENFGDVINTLNQTLITITQNTTQNIYNTTDLTQINQIIIDNIYLVNNQINILNNWVNNFSSNYGGEGLTLDLSVLFDLDILNVTNIDFDTVISLTQNNYLTENFEFIVDGKFNLNLPIEQIINVTYSAFDIIKTELLNEITNINLFHSDTNENDTDLVVLADIDLPPILDVDIDKEVNLDIVEQLCSHSISYMCMNLGCKRTMSKLKAWSALVVLLYKIT